jgi:hypothetical protein
MMSSIRRGRFFGWILLVSMFLLTSSVGAQEMAKKGWVADRDKVIEDGGVAYGMTFGNVIYPGFKAAMLILAAPQAGLAWLLSLGDTEQAKTILNSHFEGPYYIGPEQAREAMGTDAASKPPQTQYSR